MTKPSATWCAVIAATLDILLAIPSFSANDPSTAAKDGAGAALERFGSESAIRQNASQPLTADDTALYSLDRQQSETVRITAPSSTAFLEILAQPAPSGDLATVRLSEDLDFNGSPDFTYDIPFPVSGVCANGVISCTPGTWNDCQPYQWTADLTGRVSLNAVLLNNLGGCYCINQSCGSNLVWSNLAVILQDLGGGIAGVIQEKKANFVITEVKTDGPLISYYGQDTSTGQDLQGNTVSTPASQAAYYGNPAAMAGAAETEVLNQANTPESYSAMLNTSMADRGTATQVQSCAITRSAVVEQQSRVCPGGGAPDPMSGRCLAWGGSGTYTATVWNSWTQGQGGNSCDIESKKMIEVSGTSIRYGTSCLASGGADGCSCQGWWGMQATNWGGWVDLRGNGSSKVGSDLWISEGLEISGSRIRWTANMWNQNGGWIDLVPGNGTSAFSTWSSGIQLANGTIRLVNAGWSSDAPIQYLREEAAVCTYGISDSVNDLCAALASNPDCSMQEEKVDAVQTFRNFQPTSLVPLPSARSLTAASACNATEPPYATTVTRDWWRKERTYRCTSNSRFDFTGPARRLDTITASLDGNAPDQGRFDFTDTRQDSNTGAWSTDNHVINAVNSGDTPICEQVCKTRKTVQDTQAVPAGRTSDARTTTKSFDYLYRVCDGNTCPAGPDEAVIKDCQCLDEFAEAASIMSVLNEAGKDMICSDGVRK